MTFKEVCKGCDPAETARRQEAPWLKDVAFFLY